MTILVTKNFIDRIRPTLTGKPIINQRHREVEPNAYKEGEADGIIVQGRPEGDGWDYADCFIWDEETQRNIQNGYQASCQYAVTKWGPGGMYHNIPYDREALEGYYEHIAIVPKGRYEGVRIIMNAIGGVMKLFGITFGKDKEEIRTELESTNAVVVTKDGTEVPLQNAIEAYEKVEAARNAQPKKLGLEEIVEVGGKKVKVSEILAAQEALTKAKNEAEDEEKKKKEKEDMENALKNAHTKGEHSSYLENCALCNKAKNEEDEEKKKKDDEEKEKAKNAAAALDDAARRRRDPLQLPTPIGMDEKVAKGRELYGSTKSA